MANWLVDPRDRVAVANVSGTGVHLSPEDSIGVASTARTGGAPAGDYTVTLTDGVEAKDSMICFEAFGNPPAAGMGGRILSVLSPTSFRVRWYDGNGALADVSFRFLIFRIVVNR